MGRIRILSDNVANKIAAGEVVERPASVVKELLENSLDAGATEIRVDAENAGRRLLRIQDDGSGMLRDDALLAFERHATSKLSDVKDLLSISTLGFRGEALPSIASVSRLLLETRSADHDLGTAVEINGGKLVRCDDIVRPQGTTITVRDLFFNVPARKKFLRSDQTELAHIGSLVTHYSLGHHARRFEFFHEGRELLRVTPVDSLYDRAFQVFGSGIMDDLVSLELRSTELQMPPAYQPPGARAALADPIAPEKALFTVEGLVSGPHVQKLNRNSIFLFVNGRLIRDKLLLHAISAAYHNLMPSGCYPFALLFLNCDAEEVDVNVHPSKTEVRFRHGSFVHDFIRDTLRELLMQHRPASSIPLPVSPMPMHDPDHTPALHTPAFPNAALHQRAATLPFSEFSGALISYPDLEPALESQPIVKTAEDEDAEDDEASLPEIHVPVPPTFVKNPEPPPPTALPTPQPTRATRVPDTHGQLTQLPPDWDRTDSLAALPDLRPVGQLHDSFILAAGRDGLWIIDQHVAHERILFEQVLRQRSAGTVEVQQLLMPLVIQLTPSQQYEYARIADELNAYGFETEPFGNRTITVKSAPAGISTSDIEQVIVEVLDIAEVELRSASLDEIRRNVCATIACRAAIKVNMKLEPAKMAWLVQALARCEYPMTCPHGRPIALRYSTRDILKSFHRI